MKRMILLIFMTCFFFAGCNSRETHQIDDYIWEMISIQSIDEGEKLWRMARLPRTCLRRMFKKNLFVERKMGF